VLMPRAHFSATVNSDLGRATPSFRSLNDRGCSLSPLRRAHHAARNVAYRLRVEPGSSTRLVRSSPNCDACLVLSQGSIQWGEAPGANP